jgi:hypothetical protein
MHIQGTMLTDTYIARIQAAAPRTITIDALDEARNVLHGEGMNCARGIVMAIGLEAITALCVFGVWHASHLVR